MHYNKLLCKTIGLTIICLFSGILFASCTPEHSVTIEKKEDQYIIKSGNDQLTVEPVRSRKTRKFLVVGGSGRGLNPFVAHLSVMPFAQMERVLNSCGGLDVCRREGALERSGWVSSMFLYAGRKDVIKTLEDMDDIAMKWEYPLIELTYQEVRVIEHLRRVMTSYVYVDSSDFQPNFIVFKAKILQHNYQAGP